MVRILVAMARPNKPDMPPKLTKKVRLGIYFTQIQPPTPLFQSECLSTCRRNWRAPSRVCWPEFAGQANPKGFALFLRLAPNHIPLVLLFLETLA